MTSATIQAGSPGVTFIQVWTMPSAEAQRSWLQTVHERIEALTGQPGFVSMTLHPSLDGRQAVVYAQWRSREEMEAAINTPRAKAGHEAMARWGESAGTLYRVDAVYVPDGRR